MTEGLAASPDDAIAIVVPKMTSLRLWGDCGLNAALDGGAGTRCGDASEARPTREAGAPGDDRHAGECRQ